MAVQEWFTFAVHSHEKNNCRSIVNDRHDFNHRGFPGVLVKEQL